MDDVHRTIRVRLFIVERNGNNPLLHCQQAGNQLNTTTAGSQVTEIALWRENGDISQRGANGLGFDLVVRKRAQAVRVDVPDITGRQFRFFEHRPNRRFNSVTLKKSRRLTRFKPRVRRAQIGDDIRAPGFGMIESFQHDGGGAFTVNKSITITIERSRCPRGCSTAMRNLADKAAKPNRRMQSRSCSTGDHYVCLTTSENVVRFVDRQQT